MRHLLLPLLCMAALLVSCHEDEEYSQSSSDLLTFSVDAVRMDTVFSDYGSSTKTFWAFNHGGKGLRISHVRLKSGGQSGFRVNVDGSYLNLSQGAMVRNLEVRHGDSIRVFVEVTPNATNQDAPQWFSDALVFTLESGVQQSVPLEAWAWDALTLRDVVVSHDSTIDSRKPIVVFGVMRVEPGATLTLQGSQLFFHDQAGIDIYGTLRSEGTADEPVVMRGDRLDRMFANLPYHRVSGQWRGLHFFASSTGNTMAYTQVLSASDAVVVDSAGMDGLQPRLLMTRSVVHNAKGYGLRAVGASVRLDHCQLTNTLGHCLSVVGGRADVEYCTLGQFYPFSAERGRALAIANTYMKDCPADETHPAAYTRRVDVPLERFWCTGSILTGYADDVVLGTTAPDGDAAFVYLFDNSLLRTPSLEGDTTHYKAIRWEAPTDEVQGLRHFRRMDEVNFDYDFHLDSVSTALGLGCYE